MGNKSNECFQESNGVMHDGLLHLEDFEFTQEEVTRITKMSEEEYKKFSSDYARGVSIVKRIQSESSKRLKLKQDD